MNTKCADVFLCSSHKCAPARELGGHVIIYDLGSDQVLKDLTRVTS